MTDQKDMGPFAGMDRELNRAISSYGTPPYREIVQITIRDVGSYSFDKLPNTIEGWQEWLATAHAECPKEYLESLRCILRFEDSYYDSGASASLNVWYERPETDAEITERVNRGIAYVRGAEQQERATFEALKRKYGG